jgi:cytochrome c biogenesis protein CcmG/thiol:disulfide interchange protein DsbE
MSSPVPNQTEPTVETGRQRSAKRLVAMLPLLAFLILSALFAYRLYYVGKNPGSVSRIPSALINKPVPEFDLPPLAGFAGGGLNSGVLKSGLHVVNIWASWCQPCRAEHPVLMELAKDERFEMAGLNYKDVPENARRFLGNLGNPYDRIGADPDGRSSIDWGVYGVPETFIVKDGVIVYKFIGPLSEDTVKSDFLPAIEKAISGQTQ